ncbi:hypothetical protein K431DRAFT_248906 [Polychaeton citri CBS 116435]|uniref:NAD(P)-binding protein n=1 Tax=Polychaeton citri CBS 116435 TaxID=1314669 RepID=A0A9P4Q9H8_9PEZI|nr:hypothetical protein K431DRAFT_248906 [Polychaeton citri CBS 116435]
MLSAAAFLPRFLGSQLLTLLPYPTCSFRGQIVVVTDPGNESSQKAAAHVLRLDAAQVVLAAQDMEDGLLAKRTISSLSGKPEQTIDVWKLDMSSIDSIKAFTKHLRELPRLDAVFLNISTSTDDFRMCHRTEEDVTIYVVAPLLFVVLVFPILQDSARSSGQRSRLTIVGSDLMYRVNISRLPTSGSLLPWLRNENNSESRSWAGLSSLLYFYTVRDWAAHHPISEDSDVLLTMTAADTCRERPKDTEASSRSVFKSFSASNCLLGWSTETSSRAIVHAVSSDLTFEAHGRFLLGCTIASGGSNVDGDQGRFLAEQWNTELFEFLESVAPGCSKYR